MIKCAYTDLFDLIKLIPHPDNDNEHKQEHAELLADVIRANGIRHPIIVSKRSGFIVAGHLRLMAAKLLGLEQFPVDMQDFENEAEEYRFLSSDNNVARYAEFNEEKFKLKLQKLEIDLDENTKREFGLLNIDIEVGEVDLPDLGDGSDPDIQQITFTLSNEQADLIRDAMSKAEKNLDCIDQINTNTNGNKISAVARFYLGC